MSDSPGALPGDSSEALPVGVDEETGVSGLSDAARSYGLSIKGFQSSQLGEDEDDGNPSIDVVHVASKCTEQQPLAFDDLIGYVRTEQREIEYRFELSSLLMGGFTPDAVEQHASRLLRGLVASRTDDAAETKRAIVFVAYDLGALIVQKALALAARSEEAYTNVFSKTARVLFSGCPQRSPNLRAMELKLLEFLKSKTNESLPRLLTTVNIRNLASTILQTSKQFIYSKITLRCRVASLYANSKKPGRIHPAFDGFAGTLGIAAETAIEESDDENSPFPSLASAVFTYPSHWIAHKDWAPLERCLSSLSPPPYQCETAAWNTSITDPILQNNTYKAWARSVGVNVLYVHGSDYRLVRDTVDQIFLSWITTQKTLYKPEINSLSFTFNSRDPLRSSLSTLIPSLLLQSSGGTRTGETGADFRRFRNHYLAHGGGSEKSILTMFNFLRDAFFEANSVVLLNHFDECNRDSREHLLNWIDTVSRKGESSIKILITTQKPSALSERLQNWPAINVNDSVSQVPADDFLSVIGQLTDDCLIEDETERIQRMAESLRSGDDTAHIKTLKLLQAHTGWPEDRSLRALAKFTDLLAHISPGDTPARILDKLFRSNTEIGAIKWVLQWLIHAYRPLSQSELTAILCHYYHQNENKPSPRSPSLAAKLAAQESWGKLTGWLRGLVHYGNNQVALLPEIRDIIEQNDDANEYIWSGCKAGAHQAMAEFCFSYLAMDDVHALLQSLWQEYQTRIGEQDEQTPRFIHPLEADDKELLFYAIQGLPYHLSSDSDNPLAKTLVSQLSEPNSGLGKLWAEAYWGMSNPFSRSLKMPKSSLSLLTELGLISAEDLRERDSAERVPCIAALAARGRGQTLSKFLASQDFAAPTHFLMAALEAAMRADDEPVAVEIVEKIVSISDSSIAWPVHVAWAAVWLDMALLLEMLLKNGVSTDPIISDTWISSPSPLYMAVTLGHVRSVRVLIDNGANLDVMRVERYDCLQGAAFEGDLATVKELVTRHPAFLTSKFANHSLIQAIGMGNWRVVDYLLGLKLDPNAAIDSPDNPDSEWTPLASASHSGFPETVETLLRHGADPNKVGPYGTDTALWFAIVPSRSVQCVRYLLQHGADPNHSLLQPPLLCEVAEYIEEEDIAIPLAEALISGETPVNLESKGRDGQSPLMVACRQENLALVKWLLQKGVDVNQRDDQRRTALHFAVRSKNIPIVREILASHPELDVVDDWKMETALECALPNLELTEILLDAGANPEFANGNNATLLSSAVLFSSAEVVDMLLKRKVDLNHKDKWGWTPICDAVGNIRHVETVRLLADNGANLQDTAGDSESGLLHLAIFGSPKIMQILLEFRKSIDLEKRNAANSTPLLWMRSYADPESLELLIKAGADVNALNEDKEGPLHCAIREGIPRCVTMLLAQPEIELNCVSPTAGPPLHLACSVADVDSVLALLKRGANIHVDMPDIIWSTALIAALAGRGQRTDSEIKVDQIVRALVHDGANVQATIRGATFHSPIFAASLGAGVGTINFLLDEGASAQQADPGSERLPHHLAAANGIVNFETMLLSYRGDIMAADKTGKNCLHWAAQYGNAKTVEFILGRLANQPARRARYVDQVDNDGWTPLCFASRPYFSQSFAGGMRSESSDWAGVIRILIEHGASRDVRCQLGTDTHVERLSPLDLAKRCSADAEIIELLEYGLDGKPFPDENETPTVEEDAPPVKLWSMYPTTCDICFTPIIGRTYDCKDCPDFASCLKCFPSAKIFHSEATKNDGKTHNLERRDRQEFQDEPEEQEVEESVKGAADGAAAAETINVAAIDDSLIDFDLEDEDAD